MTRTKKVIALLAALALTVTMAAPALALGEIDGNEPGRIAVKVQDPGFQEDLAESTVEVTVYQVATVNQHGAFALTDAFLPLQDNAQWRGGILNSDSQLRELLEAAMELVYPAPAESETPAEPAEPAIEALLTAEAPVQDGKIELADDPDTELGENQGLFLVIPGGVQTEHWVYEFNPALLAVPSIERATESNGLAEDRWQYEVPMYLKGDREHRLTELMIEKTLREYNATLGETTFLFDVQADIGGEAVFSQLVPLVFSGTGTMSATVSGIPVGAHVTVTEVYSGASYEAVNGRVEVSELPLPDEVDGMYRVAFTNTYTDRQNPDTSLVNTWVHEGEGWRWQSGEEAG